MNWTTLPFRKYHDKTLPQVVFQDPDWFFWAYETKLFENKGSLREEAEEIYRKATSIKIPQTGTERLVAEYAICHDTGKFLDVELVPETRSEHVGSTATERRNVFDLSVPRQHSHYDKRGCKRLVSSLKRYLFHDRKFRLTKQRCENFFNDDSNFVL
jgi:hypothetical protein